MGAESLNLRRIALIASGRVGFLELNPVKVRVEATSAFKQLTLSDHARGRGAVGELAGAGSGWSPAPGSGA